MVIKLIRKLATLPIEVLLMIVVLIYTLADGTAALLGQLCQWIEGDQK